MRAARQHRLGKGRQGASVGQVGLQQGALELLGLCVMLASSVEGEGGRKGRLKSQGLRGT